MKNIHCHVLSDGYAARVKDTKSYASVTYVFLSLVLLVNTSLLPRLRKDILARWSFPLVPDDNHPGGHNYEHLRGNKYIAKGNSVTLSRYVQHLH